MRILETHGLISTTCYQLIIMCSSALGLMKARQGGHGSTNGWLYHRH